MRRIVPGASGPPRTPRRPTAFDRSDRDRWPSADERDRAERRQEVPIEEAAGLLDGARREVLRGELEPSLDQLTDGCIGSSGPVLVRLR